MRRALLLGTGLALVVASPAAAADVTVRGLDSQVFDKPDIKLAVGDRVIWSFDPGLPHNAVATSANWAGFGNVPAVPAPPTEFTFTAEGIYTYVCEVHATTMQGKVTVGNPPPPPPPPLSAQPFTNDASFDPAAVETGGLDTTRPELRNVALDRSGRRLKLRFRVSERSEVTVRLVRAGKRVRTKRVAAGSRGSVTLRGLRPGRYRVQLRARDLAGNASARRVAHVTVG